MPDSTKTPAAVRVVSATIALTLFVLLGTAVLEIPETEPGLAPLVAERLEDSGVKNPITAVLLNFRGYDTMLEIAVLVLATLGVLSLRTDLPGTWAALAPQADPVLSALTRLLTPVMIVVAGYLLWAGEHAPGGAFQAGSVLGAAGVLLSLAGYARPGWVTRFALRVAISIGFVVFLITAIAPMFGAHELLAYPESIAKELMLIVETWLTLSIGVILVSLFIASASPADEMYDYPGGVGR